MAQKRLHVGIGARRTRKNARFASESAFIAEMRQTSNDVCRAMLDILDQFEDVSEEIMINALEPTLDRAKYYCPKDTLELVNSAYLEEARFRGKPRVEIGFAKGGDPVYAIYVHEILDYKHDEPTRAKFLEYAVYEDLDGIYTRLGDGYRRFMGGGR
jgi:hypothetical protein